MKAAESFPGAAFWHEAFALRGAATARVLPRTFVFVLAAALVGLLHRAVPWLAIRADVMEASGLILGLLLVFRTAAGYERWWEARRLWGEIVNQSRNLVIAALAYGPADRSWRDGLARWVAAFAHVTRSTLRDERKLPEVVALLGEAEAERIATAEHMPSYVACRIAALLERACKDHGLDRFAFLQIDRERAALIDHVGGCERILSTPIPKVYSVTIRRFVVIYLLALPFALTGAVGLAAPVYAIFIAYPILTLEQIGAELQNPFVPRSLSHLDLTALCATIERNVRSLANEWDHPPTPIDRDDRQLGMWTPSSTGADATM
jgi:ion channel-forming bestrophin family protein